MIKYIRVIWLVLLVVLALYIGNEEIIIPLEIICMMVYLLINYSIIQIKILRKNILCIGFKRFYVVGLLFQLLITVLFLVPYFFNYYKVLPFQIDRLLIVFIYFFSIILIDSKKHVFYITDHYIFHKHNFKIIQWKFRDIDKVYVYLHKIEFVKANKKLKIAFTDDKYKMAEIYSFLKKQVGEKLIVKTV